MPRPPEQAVAHFAGEQTDDRCVGGEHQPKHDAAQVVVAGHGEDSLGQPQAGGERMIGQTKARYDVGQRQGGGDGLVLELRAQEYAGDQHRQKKRDAENPAGFSTGTKRVISSMIITPAPLHSATNGIRNRWSRPAIIGPMPLNTA